MLDHPRSLLRLMGIAAILARHDALSPLVTAGLLPRPFGLLQWFAKRELTPSRPGQRLAKAAVALGPTFIKAGQLLSTRADIVGETAAADLAELQDRLPPFPFAQVRQTIEEAFGCPMEQLYRAFDPVPVAAASIAQVHFAETIEGEFVAVKVLRPDIESWFERDLRLFVLIAESLEKVRPDLRRLKPRLVVEQFGKDLKFETDLRFEAAAAAELAENFLGDPGFRVPKVDWRRTAKRVLTLERVAGERVDDPATLVATGRDPRKVMENAANAFFNQVFRDGFFHADMHPGNSFVAEDNAIIAIDFGIMGRLDRRTRYFLADMLMAFLSGNYRKVAEVHFAAGYVPPDQSIEAFTQACRSIGEPLLGRPLQEISVGRLLAQLFEVTETFQMETQPQLLLLQKSMVVAEGVGRRLDPDVNMWTLARPLIEDWMAEHRGPLAQLRQSAESVMATIERAPRVFEKLDRVMDDLSDGGLRLHPATVRALAAALNEGRSRRWMAAGWYVAAILLLLLVMALVGA